MPASNRSPQRIHALERLAKKIYDESNTGPKPWLQLGWDVREAWLNKAEAVLDTARSPFSWLFFWRPARKPGGATQPPQGAPTGDHHGQGSTSFQPRS